MELRFADIQMTSAITEMGLNVVYKYLADRGITIEDIEARGVTIGMAHDLGLVTDERMCVVFPHFDARGDIIDWWSSRLVDTAPRPPRGFAALVPQKRMKMYCPPREAPAAYLDPTLDWTQVEEGSVIYIHESVIKAINGAKCGYYSIGLNGVWGWGSKKHEIALVSQLRDLPWKAKKLKCVVVFDSNAATNDDVALAIRKFAERMRLVCGVEVLHHLLPPDPDGKDWGFDDYCAHYGYDAAGSFLGDLDEAHPVDLSEVETLKLQLNAEVCVVRSIKRVVEQQTGTMMGKGEFTDMNYAHYIASYDDKVVNVPRLWLAWDRRRVVEKLEYSPGEVLIKDGAFLNLWRGMGVEADKGDVAPWLQLVERVIPDAALRRWVTQWFAYPLQNLGAKLNTYIHMYGPPGGGKNAILTPLLGIYGDNGIQLGRERIASDFNEVYATKQFINLDELHGGNEKDGLAIGNKIKMLVTAPKLTVNGKGKGEYQVANHVNLVTSANYADAIKLDEGDRRCLVLRIGTRDTVIKDRSYWMPYFKWAESVEGQAALYDYLLQVDCSDFDPRGWAPATAEKEHVTDATRSPMEKWARELKEDREAVLEAFFAKAPALTMDALASAYVGTEGGGVVTQGIKNRLGMVLADAGFRRTDNLRVNEKTTKRLWVMQASLNGAPDVEIRDAYIEWKKTAKF